MRIDFKLSLLFLIRRFATTLTVEETDFSADLLSIVIHDGIVSNEILD